MNSSPDPRGSTSLKLPAPPDGLEVTRLSSGWEAAATPPDSCKSPAELEALSWWPARMPGTAASVLADAGLWRPGEPYDFDAEDWWFRTRFAAEHATHGEQVVLRLDGIATVAEIYLNGELVLESESMFAAHTIDVSERLMDANELAIRCRALAPLLRKPRRPRARWRTRLVADGNLRFFRTMLMGRAPGFAPGPAAVGPWRGANLERHRRLAIDELTLRPRLVGEDGVLSVHARLRTLAGLPPMSVEIELSRAPGEASHRASLTLSSTAADGTAREELTADGELLVPGVTRWWPHTHGEPNLYAARLLIGWESRSAGEDSGDAARSAGRDGAQSPEGDLQEKPTAITATGAQMMSVATRRVGFRSLAAGPTSAHDVLRDGLDLHINGVRVFARGCVWTPPNFVTLECSETELRGALEQVRDAGMNMLRLPGTGTYETDGFHDLCDELGILVWQDFMFANLDYPIAEEAFRAAVESESRQELDRVAGRPSLAVLCGNSEIEQQVAMLGLDPSLGRGELFGERLPALARESGADAVYVPSAPCGGNLPFRTDRGVANYYGVGGYRRPLDDARRAAVRFAAECLAFSNVPEQAAIEELLPETPGDMVVHHPRWKAGVPRDVGSGWDFEDVRDHYLRLLFDVDPVELRRVDHERYLALSRAVTGEAMAEVFGEWRRAASPCGGGLVLWLRDLVPGAGWGVVDHRGEAKTAYHHLRRVLAPVVVWMTDEGLGGIAAHVANDRPTTLNARLRVALYRDFEHRVDEVNELVELAPHSVRDWDIETLMGHFADVSWAYRFGPPQQNLIVASLERVGAETQALISQSVQFPAGRPTAVESATCIGLEASTLTLCDGSPAVWVRTGRFAYGVRLRIPGFLAVDDAFSVEPGGERTVPLRPRESGAALGGGTLTALNLQGSVRVQAAQTDSRTGTVEGVEQ